MKKWWILSIIILLLIVGAFFYIYTNADFSPSSTYLEKCVTLQENNEKGINIVFFGKDKETAQSYLDYFMAFEPYEKYEDRFNFYYIPNYKPKCELYKDVAVLCYSREIVTKAGSCPNDHIVVLTDEFDRVIRSSNYLNVMSLNIAHPVSVFPHEFGHSFINLAEEYTPAKLPRNHPGNCVAECTDFKGKINGCFEGCSLENYQRSVDNGVMRTLKSTTYGIFDDYLLTKKILEITKPSVTITGNVIAEEINCSNENYYLLEGGYYEGDIQILKTAIEKGCVGSAGSGEYSYKLKEPSLSPEEKTLTGQFNPRIIYTDAPGEVQNSPTIDGEVLQSEVNFYLKIPMIKNLEEFQIINPDGYIISSTTLKCENILGDTNGDGKVDNFDVETLGDYLRGDTQMIECKENADINQDKSLDLSDIVSLSEMIEKSENAQEQQSNPNIETQTSSYQELTKKSGFFSNKNSIDISTISSGSDFNSAVFHLYNSNHELISTQISKEKQANIVFHNLADSLYFYSATINYTNSLIIALEERNITLDTKTPLVSLLSPLNKDYNSPINSAEYSLSDENLKDCWYSIDKGAVNTTLACNSNTTEIISQEGENFLSLWAKDKAGNINSASVIFSITPPEKIINYAENTEVDNSIVDKNWIYVNVSVKPINESEIIFTLFNNSQILFENKFLDKRRDIKWENLQNGTYRFNVSVKDNFGNIYTTENRKITLGDGFLPLKTTQDNSFFERITSLVIKKITGWFFKE